MKNVVQDVKIYIDRDIYSNHFLLVSMVTLLGRWMKPRTNEKLFRAKNYTMQLLQEESLINLYRN